MSPKGLSVLLGLAELLLRVELEGLRDVVGEEELVEIAVVVAFALSKVTTSCPTREVFSYR